MSAPIPEPPAQTEPTDRRERNSRGGDRRAEPGETRRARRPSRWARWSGIAGRDALIILGTVSAIVFSIRHVNPIFSGQPTVAASITKALPIAKAAFPNAASPQDTSQIAQMMASPQFEKDRQAFAKDLVSTGRMTQARADSIAYYAVRESYRNGIPPAVVFGVLLTENARFVSGAMSNVGAVGLMQVYPKVWLKALSAKFGSDLATDSTNLKYGIYILKQYVKSDSGAVTQANMSKGLLRYNGCVRGTNTPNCKTYPNKVTKYVEEAGNAICGDKSFVDCIAKPFISGLLGKKPDTSANTQ